MSISRITEFLFWGTAGWCGIGLVGAILSMFRRRRNEALRHALLVCSVGSTYLLIVLAVSAMQKQRTIAPGRAVCFNSLCFRTIAVDEVPLPNSSREKIIRVHIAITNTGQPTMSDSGVKAYLVDSSGSEWFPLPGLSGIPLTVRVASHAEVISEPIFRVPREARGLGLVFTHGTWTTRRLIIGDSDSLGHRPDLFALSESP